VSVAPEVDVNKTAIEYADVFAGALFEKIDNITVTVNITYYNTSGSAKTDNENATLWLEAYNGTTYINISNFTRATGNQSIIITNSDVLNGWSTVSNRDIKISARFMDYNNTGEFDTINWTDVWVEFYSEQKLLNDTWIPFTDCYVENTTCPMNVSKLVTSSVGATIEWCAAANDTSNYWNYSSCANPFSYVTTSSGVASLNYSIWTGSVWALYNNSQIMNFYCDEAATDCEPINQNAAGSQCITQACNNGTLAGSTVGIYINATCSGMDLKADDDYTSSGAIVLSTSEQTIHTTLGVGECIDICMWLDLDNPETPCILKPYVSII
jgi:hypothetical protein